MKHERLSALDRGFLDVEEPSTHMHIASVGLFEAGPLRAGDGRIDLERIERYVASRLHLIPRYRQRIEHTPLEGHPIWVDDDRFNLRYHIRHTALPAPGDERILKRLCGRILSQQLDRGKPLWELWIVEGLEGDRVAVISKVHHCMIDGLSGVHLLTVLLGAAGADMDSPPWTPEPPPTPMELVADAVEHGLLKPLEAVRNTVAAVREPGTILDRARESAHAAAHAFGAWSQSASPSPLNQPIGPHRRFDWHQTSLADVKTVKSELGGTVNDVVLAIVGGALGRYFRGRGVSDHELSEMRFRVFCPVSMRPKGAPTGFGGNEVVMVVTDVPVNIEDPGERLRVVRASMDAVKRSHQAEGVNLAVKLGAWGSPTMVTWALRAGFERTPANLVVTNVPGPPMPLALLGARMLEAYPLVPLYRNQGLGVALFSYDGALFWGFNADWDLLPDLHDLVLAVEAELDGYRRAASTDQSAAQTRP